MSVGIMLNDKWRIWDGKRTSASGLEHNFVVQTQTQFGHAGEVAFHLDSAENFRSYDVSVSINLIWTSVRV
jgi:hypothetical protein